MVFTRMLTSVSTLDNQTNLINNITGLSENYFTRLASQLTSGASDLNGRITTNNGDELSAHANYSRVAGNT